jgi:hypothetical protein
VALGRLRTAERAAGEHPGVVGMRSRRRASPCRRS